VPKGRGIRVAQAIETRQLLIGAAHRLFAEKGFHATTTLEIVTLAGVTRGALQHHFPRKEDLFRAVSEQAAKALVESTGERVAVEGWSGFVADADNFIRNVASHDFQRISFVDGPAVLGWTEWRKLQIDHGLLMIESAIADGISKGAITPQAPRALAHLIRSLVEEASLMTLNADELKIKPEEVEGALMTLLLNLNSPAQI
jgi:AcrR family transcriptional regulator